MPPRRPSRPNSVPVPVEDFEDHRLEDEGVTPATNAGRKQLFKELLGRWYWMALGLVVGLLIAGYYLSKVPKRYNATASLLLKQHVATVMKNDQVEDIDPRSEEAMNTAVERIRRLDLLERVAERPEIRQLPGLVPPPVDWRPVWMGGEKKPQVATKAPPPPAALAGALSSWLNVSIGRGTRLVYVTIQHTDPKVAKALADAVTNQYLEEVAGARSAGRNTSTDLLMKGSEEARQRLQSAQGALAIYGRALELHKELETKEKEVQQLERRYLPKHPKMAAAEAQLASQQERFLEAFQIARKAKADEAYWKTSDAQLDAEDHLQAVSTARQLLLSRISVLQSETDSQTSVFNSMLTRIEESGVNGQSDDSPAELNSLSRLPGQAALPQPNKCYALGGAAGLMAGLALALLLGRLDNKFHTVAQLEAHTGHAVLSAIANMPPRALVAARKVSAKRQPVKDDAPADPIQEQWNERLVFCPELSASTYAEMFRVLRASVSLLGDEEKRRITLFTSALPGEGKTMVSTNFALAAASQGRRTLLIDLDLRKPSVHKMFGFTREHTGGGVTEYLSNHVSFEDAIVHDTGHPMLDVILAGKRAPNPGELLNGTRLNDILDRATRSYDVVVIDSAPLLAVPDTRIIAPLVDNLCLVVRAEYVPKGAVTRTLEILESANTFPSGLILNGFQEKRRFIGENYTYGYYGGGRYGYGSYGAYGVYGNDDDEDETPRPAVKRPKPSSRRRVG